MYQVGYYIEFVALDETKYRIELLRESKGTLTPIPLRGAVSPIETVEDNSDNIFLPIRKQTGKLSIADNGYDLNGNKFYYTTLIPNNIFEYQVRLWSIASDLSETLRWIGYIRPDSLTSRIFEEVTIREYQITCPLGAMYDTPVSFSNTKSDKGTVKSIGQILHMALSSVRVNWNRVYKQDNVESNEDIKAKLSLLNFVDNTPTHTNPASGDIDAFTATWTDASAKWADVVEDICKFWGWTMFSRGLDIYIVAHGQYLSFKYFAFDNIASNSPVSTVISDWETAYAVNLKELQYVSTDHTESRQLGYSSINIHNNVNTRETVVNPDYQKLPMSYLTDGQKIVHQSNDYYYILRRLGYASSQASDTNAFIDNYQINENRMLTTGHAVPFVFCYTDGWDGYTYPTKTEFSLKMGIACYTAGTPRGETTPPQHPMFWVKTLEDVILPKNSVMCLQAKADISYNPDPEYPTGGIVSGSKPVNPQPTESANTMLPYDPQQVQGQSSRWDLKPVFEATYNNQPLNRKITVALRIGDKYWSPGNGEWVDNAVHFDISIRPDGSIVSPVNADQGGILFDDHYGSNGYCIYNTGSEGLCGRLKLTVYNNSSSLDFSRLFNCLLTNLQVGIYNTDSKLYPQAKDSHTYKKDANTVFQNKLDVNLNLASGSLNKYGLGQLYNSDLSMLESASFRTAPGLYESFLPENRLLNVMAAIYEHITYQYTIEVSDEELTCCPIAWFTEHWSLEGRSFFLQSCTHKWRDGKVRITIIDK